MIYVWPNNDLPLYDRNYAIESKGLGWCGVLEEIECQKGLLNDLPDIICKQRMNGVYNTLPNNKFLDVL